MIKKTLAMALSVMLVVTLLAGCIGTSGEGGKNLRVGMVTDLGNIDDKSFNQGVWEGIVKAGSDFGLETKYFRPTGDTESDYLKEIGNLHDAGYNLIVCPGFKIETAVFKAQDKFSRDTKFIIIDGSPNAGDGKAVVKPNTVSIFFAEHESGFIAGVATALQLNTGDVGFIGGMEISSVQKYNWGFQQGITYANDSLGTKITIKGENVVYQGSFDNVPAGQRLSEQMFDRGVIAIFTAAGGVGIGAINEAKARAKDGKKVWIVGVDVDQYADGEYNGKNSIIMTSAMKKIDQATYEMIKAERDGKFPGGQTLTYDSKNNGIGLPAKNPNLSDDVIRKVDDIAKKLQSGKIKVFG